MEMMPIVDGLNVEFEGRVSVFQLDAAQSANASLQTMYGLRGHPSFVVLDREDRIIERYFGPQTVTVLRESMEAAAGN
jgi:hypothetical protein